MWEIISVTKTPRGWKVQGERRTYGYYPSFEMAQRRSEQVRVSRRKKKATA